MGDEAVSSRILPACPHITQYSRYLAKQASELCLIVILQYCTYNVKKKIKNTVFIKSKTLFVSISLINMQ